LRLYIRTRTPSYAWDYEKAGIWIDGNKKVRYKLPAGANYVRFMGILNNGTNVTWHKFTEFEIELPERYRVDVLDICPVDTTRVRFPMKQRDPW